MIHFCSGVHLEWIPGKHVKLEFGAYSTISYTQKISENAVYTGRLDLFSNYLHDPQNVDINLTNLLAVKVTGILTMTLAFNLIYDNDVSTVKADGTIGGACTAATGITGYWAVTKTLIVKPVIFMLLKISLNVMIYFVL